MKNFSEYNLSEPLQKALIDLGFTTPSPIQEQTLPILLEENVDLLGMAATGTGKTGAFAIPLLEKLDLSIKGVQAIILCPTRELALQVCNQISLIGKYKKVRTVPIYGGGGYAEQIGGLRSGASIVVGTPGRVIDHLERKTLDLKNIKTVILDEADEMISMGFKEDLEKILESAPKDQANTWLFSATMSPGVQKVAQRYLKNPKKVQVNQTDVIPQELEQIYYFTKESSKPEVLCKIIDSVSEFYGIIFCQTKSLVTDLTQYLASKGYKTDCLHGDLTQKARDKAMKGFRDRRTSILVATDVACRGLDVNDITHVVNFSIPRELENYIHRIGRTGRNGKKGVAISLVTKSHRSLLRDIERMTKMPVNEAIIPTRKEIGIKKIANDLTTFKSQEKFKQAIELLSEDWKTSLEELSKEEIAGRFLSLLHPEIFIKEEESSSLDIFKSQEESNDQSDGYGRRRDRNRRGGSGDGRSSERRGDPRRRSGGGFGGGGRRDGGRSGSSDRGRFAGGRSFGGGAPLRFKKEGEGSSASPFAGEKRTFSDKKPPVRRFAKNKPAYSQPIAQ